MKIAIIAPSPVPFGIGGIENLVSRICNEINQNTIHCAEIIKLPCKEFEFWDLIESYYSFYNLDVKHFDMVITLKYPAWMVNHHNHVCYMFHCLRGLYDTYDQFGLDSEIESGIKYIDEVIRYMEQNKNPYSLDSFFSKIFNLREHIFEIPSQYFKFPGPFIRRIIHYMDNFALSHNGIKKFYATSKVVKNRVEYYPKNTDVEVLYPPSTQQKFSEGSQDHLFIISRLDYPKRIDMLIRTMAYVKSDVKLYIAGTGPHEEELKQMASGDKRIEFLGFITDEQADFYYSNCIAVPYFPYDEDYGLITIEAMMHKKPVITTKDSGGPTELIVDGLNGYITEFKEKQIAQKIDYLIAHKDIAYKMGENAYNSVKYTTWKNTIDKLIYYNKNNENVKITVLSTFSVFPPKGGGQLRIYNLLKEYANNGIVIELIVLVDISQNYEEVNICDNFTEIRIPKSEAQMAADWEIEKIAKIPTSDISAINNSKLTQEFAKAVEESITTSNIIILEHPYLLNEVKKFYKDKYIIYDSHNAEAFMKEGMLPSSKIKKELLKQVFDIEKECCEIADIIFTCSTEDQEKYTDMYNVNPNKMILVPNGVDCSQIRFTSLDDRVQNKKIFKLQNEKIGLFMGSWHQPNLEACEYIFDIAVGCPDTKFLLTGSQCNYFRNYKIPENVGLMGFINDKTKNNVLSVVDFALNPMASGSGTNLKMFEYMAAGIPIISTEFGTRGINEKKNFFSCNIDKMSKIIDEFNILECDEKICNNREYVENVFDWKIIAKPAIKQILKLYNKGVKK